MSAVVNWESLCVVHTVDPAWGDWESIRVVTLPPRVWSLLGSGTLHLGVSSDSETSRSDQSGTRTYDPSPFARSTDLAQSPGQVLVGRFEIRKLLGRGGFGEVYEAYDRSLKTTVALKCLRTDRQSPSALRRMCREVAIARRVLHPRIVRVHDIGSDEGSNTLFLTMEMVRGESLKKYLARERPSVETVVGITIQILEGLSALHAADIVHRDIKPANVLIDADGQVRLSDFGIARSLEPDATETGGFSGTFEYVAPEQALGEPPARASDLYSLGLVLFEMLTGSRPGAQGGPVGTLRSRLESGALDPRQYRPELPRWISRTVATLTDRDPARRPRSADTVLSALCKGEGMSPRRGYRVILALTALVLVLFCLSWLTSRERDLESRIVVESETVRMVDEMGRVLWSLERSSPYPLAASQFGLARLEAGGPERVVGFPEGPQRLHVLDARTGKLVEIVPIPGLPRKSWPETFTQKFRPQLWVEDLDGDAVDEVILSYQHETYYPSYSVLWSPRTSERRVVFIANGHHRYAGSLDVDSDNQKELLFVGIANRMGWFGGLAAVRTPDTDSNERFWEPAETPDRRQEIGDDDASLAWYALLQPTECNKPNCVRIDPETGQVYLQSLDGKSRSFDPRGFDDVVGPTEAAQRRYSRRIAYGHLRESQRLSSGGFLDLALESATLGLESARESGDSILSHWVQILRGKLLAKTGLPREADHLFEEEFLRTEQAHDVAFAAGTAHFLGGNPDRAIEWFSKGFTVGGNGVAGRPTYESLIGLALVGAEYDPERVASEILRYGALYPAEARHRVMAQSYLDWRNGESVTLPPELSLENLSIDLYRYWWLEWNRTSMTPPQFASLVKTESQRSSLSLLLDALLLSTSPNSELEDSLRRTNQIKRAFEFESSNDIVLLAHRDLVQARIVGSRTLD